MADPVSLGLALVGLVGGGISAAGQLEAGQAQSESAAYQAQVAANNAKIAQANARLDIQSGEASSFNQGLKTRAQVGSQKAGFGAAGVDPNTGSAAAVTSGTDELGYLDALTIRSNAAKQAYGQEVAATSDTAQSGLDTAKSQQATEGSEIGAAGSLLSSASTVGRNYAGLQNVSGGGSNYGPLSFIGMSNPGEFGFTG